MPENFSALPKIILLLFLLLTVLPHSLSAKSRGVNWSKKAYVSNRTSPMGIGMQLGQRLKHHLPRSHNRTIVQSQLRHSHHHSYRTSTAPAAPAAVEAATQTSGYLTKELQHAAAAVRLAAKLCQGVQEQLGDSEKADKKDDSPVTVADYGAQAVVAWSLRRHESAATFSMVAEETSSELRHPSGRPMLQRITQLINSVIVTESPTAKVSEDEVLTLIDAGGSDGGPHGRHWVLDPIDGTRGFVAMRQYAVCLGLIEEGKVVLGVLGCPNLPQGAVLDEDGTAQAVGSANANASTTGCLFSATLGGGTHQSPLWDASAKPHRLHVVDTTSGPAARFMESFEARHSDHTMTAEVAGRLGISAPPLRMDSQVKYGLLARGAASIFMRFPPSTYREKIWDHAAGAILVQEAGGLVTDGQGRPLDFSRGRFLDLGGMQAIVAAPPKLHSALMSAIAAAADHRRK